VLITKDLQQQRSERRTQAAVSISALMATLRKATYAWPERFGEVKYRVFLENVWKELNRLISETEEKGVSK
jgi:hypothetical protein